MSKDRLSAASRSREKAPGLSLDAPLPPLPFTPLEIEAHSGDGSRSTLGGDNTSSRVRKKEVMPRKSSLKLTSSFNDNDSNGLSSKPREGPSLHARFKLTHSPSGGPVNDTTASPSSASSSRSKQRQRPPPARVAPISRQNSREKFVSSQLDITKWQKQRMEQKQDTGRTYS